MMIDRRWVKRNLGFDPIATPAPASTFSFTRAERIIQPRGSAERDHRFRFRGTGRKRVPGIHDRDRTLTIYRCAVAQRTCAENRQGSLREGSGGRSANGRRAGGYVDRRRRSCAEPRAHARQGFPKRLSPLHPQFRIHLHERCVPAARRSRRNAWVRIGPQRSERRASLSSSPIRICRRMARSFRI